MADIFSTMLGNLQALGFFQFLFPFLLILAIAYGALKFSLGNVLGKPASGLIAIIIAFFVMNYSGTVGYQIATFFSTLFGTGLIVASGILVLVILLALLGLPIGAITAHKEKMPLVTIVFVLAIAFIVFLMFIGSFGGSTGLPGLGFINLTSDFWSILFFVLILLVVLWFLTREEEGAEGGGKKG